MENYEIGISQEHKAIKGKRCHTESEAGLVLSRAGLEVELHFTVCAYFRHHFGNQQSISIG